MKHCVNMMSKHIGVLNIEIQSFFLLLAFLSSYLIGPVVNIDRLLLHAALRTYIPPTSKAMTGLDAFEEFLRMPPGLMKVKREAEAARYAQPYQKILKYNGFKTIKMLKRCSATQMTALGIPAALAQMIGRLMRQLFRSWKNVDASYLEKLSVGFQNKNCHWLQWIPLSKRHKDKAIT